MTSTRTPRTPPPRRPETPAERLARLERDPRAALWYAPETDAERAMGEAWRRELAEAAAAAPDNN